MKFHIQDNIDWEPPSLHYPARGQAPEIFAPLVKNNWQAVACLWKEGLFPSNKLLYATTWQGWVYFFRQVYCSYFYSA
ncbi:hypothetical protein D5018_21415 [Parashewanella curva]|uniref:Uncharacterized protein n=1 Tax=Parashewanella curva TaxID=2338552 RepID=A0A3L8PQH9_9GAMM|nr:hypothetical protein D5018_21415 [Parashewanella curva]